MFFTLGPWYDGNNELTDRVHALSPYAARGMRTACDRHDRIFRHGGDRFMPAPTPAGEGYAAAFSISLWIPENRGNRPCEKPR
jgi:hypothetical protein